MKMLWVLLLAAATAVPASTFTFPSGSAGVEGLLAAPPGTVRGLILYFHRAIEDRSAVDAWGPLLNPGGWAVAGYTRTGSTNKVVEAQGAARRLRQEPRLGRVPLVAMGASMGAATAAAWFAADPQVRALVLIVPADADATCRNLKEAGGRPVLLIQADRDEVVPADQAAAIRKCLPADATSKILPDHTHRFPPSDVSAAILQWLTASLK